MHRVAFTFSAFPWPQWECVKSWNVVDGWASRAVDVDRRSRVRRLRLLSPASVVLGQADPRVVLAEYLAALPPEVKAALAAEARVNGRP